MIRRPPRTLRSPLSRCRRRSPLFTTTWVISKWSASSGSGIAGVIRVSARANSSVAPAKGVRSATKTIRKARKIMAPAMDIQWLNFVHAVYNTAGRRIDKGFCYILCCVHLQAHLGYPVCLGGTGYQGDRAQNDLVAHYRVALGALGKAFCERKIRWQFIEFDAVHLLYIPQQGVAIEHEVTEEGTLGQVLRCLPATQGLAKFRKYRRCGEHGDDVSGRDFQVFGGLQALAIPEDPGNGGVVRKPQLLEPFR